jgi:hypothetical protein
MDNELLIQAIVSVGLVTMLMLGVFKVVADISKT